MPGTPLMPLSYPAASAGYATPSLQARPSHGRFVVWLIVYALLSIAILGGLKVGGFSFVFRTR